LLKFHFFLLGSFLDLDIFFVGIGLGFAIRCLGFAFGLRMLNLPNSIFLLNTIKKIQSITIPKNAH